MEMAENNEDVGSLTDIAEEQLKAKIAEEEALQRECEDLQLNYEKVAAENLEVSEELSHCFSVYPRGKMILDHILSETMKRCDTLTTDVVDKLEEEKYEWGEHTEQSCDEYTMMAHEDLAVEIERMKRENELIKQRLGGELQESKNAIHEDDDKLNSLEEEASKFHAYVAEMRSEQKNLERELGQNSSSQVVLSQNNEILNGLEERFNEMYTNDME